MRLRTDTLAEAELAADALGEAMAMTIYVIAVAGQGGYELVDAGYLAEVAGPEVSVLSAWPVAS